MDNKQVTADWIAQQRAVCDAATPGPWESKHYGRYEDHDECCIALTDDSIEPSKYENADFIAAARTGWPAALDALEASMQREAEKEAEISRLKIELSRPESYYLLNKIIDLTAERDAEKKRADAAEDRIHKTRLYLQAALRRHLNTDAPKEHTIFPSCQGSGVGCVYDSNCPHCGMEGEVSTDDTGAPTGAESDPIKDVSMKGISIHNCGDVKSQKIISIKTMDDNIDL